MRWIFSICLFLGLSISANALTFSTIVSDNEQLMDWSAASSWTDHIAPTALRSGDEVIINGSVVCEQELNLNGATLIVNGQLTIEKTGSIEVNGGRVLVNGVLSVLEGSIDRQDLEIATGAQYEEWNSSNWHLIGSVLDENEKKALDAADDLFIYPNPAKAGQTLRIGGTVLALESGNREYRIVAAGDGTTITTGILSNDDTRIPVEGIMPPGAYLFILEGHQKILYFTVSNN